MKRPLRRPDAEFGRPSTLDDKPNFMKSLKWLAIVLAIVAVVGGPLYYIFCLNHISLNHCGIAYDSQSGSVEVQPPGWHKTNVFVRVMAVSTLPTTVQIPSSARLINQRLVRFKPEGAIDYVKEQGFDWINDTEFASIMLGYAYSGREFTFMEVLEKNDGMGAATVKR
jgi:hypothetical protein